jgi:hypothetical protein
MGGKPSNPQMNTDKHGLKTGWPNKASGPTVATNQPLPSGFLCLISVDRWIRCSLGSRSKKIAASAPSQGVVAGMAALSRVA